MEKLITSLESEDLDYDSVVDLYKKYVNSTYVSLLSSFPFGRELVESAEGPYLNMKNGELLSAAHGGNKETFKKKIELYFKTRYSSFSRTTIHSFVYRSTWFRYSSNIVRI